MNKENSGLLSDNLEAAGVAVSNNANADVISRKTHVEVKLLL